MDRIGDTCLYVGDRDAAESLKRFNGAEITHILTVDNTPLKWIQVISICLPLTQTPAGILDSALDFGFACHLVTRDKKGDKRKKERKF